MTTTLEIGRLHARYAGDAAGQAGELDTALRRVAEDGLEAEATGVRLPDAFAVCVPEVTVAVRLDPGRPVASTSRDWARAILAAVQHRLDDGRDVVAYARLVDALDDVVRSSAARDWTRVWAWVQAGLVGHTFPGSAPYGGAVAETLARHPEWVAAVLVRAGAQAERVLGASDWVRLAGVVRQAVGGPGPRTPASGAPVPMTRSARAGSTVPAAVWAEVGSAAQRWDLAVLTLALTDPARSRDAVAVAAVLVDAPGRGAGLSAGSAAGSAGSAAAGSAAGESFPGTDGSGRTSPSERADDPQSGVDPSGGLAVAATSEVAGRAEGSREAPDLAEPEVRTSSWGGVLYCIHAITALGLVEELARSEAVGSDIGVALAHVLGAVTGAPADDAAVLTAAGCQLPLQVGEQLTADAGERRDARAAVVRAWVAERLGEPVDADLAWVWRRAVTLESEPGWLDATFPLSSVDLRLRLAGLDLDPGHVWWLGGVVRFHHV